jgi:hypothetical protein
MSHGLRERLQGEVAEGLWVELGCELDVYYERREVE